MYRELDFAIRISCWPAPLAMFTIHGPPSHRTHPTEGSLERSHTTFIPITIVNSIHSVKSLGTVKNYRFETKSWPRGGDFRSKSERFLCSHAGCHFYQFHEVADSSTFSELRGKEGQMGIQTFSPIRVRYESDKSRVLPKFMPRSSYKSHLAGRVVTHEIGKRH